MSEKPTPDRLQDLIYAALLGESSWQAFLDELSGILPNGKSVLFFHDADLSAGAFSLSSGLDEGCISAYSSHYSTVNPWMAGASTRPVGEPVCAEAMVPPSELFQSEYYNDFLLPRDVHTGVGVTLIRENSCNFLLSVTGYALEDSPNDDPILLLDSCVPHLRRAFQYYRRNHATAALPGRAALAKTAGIGVLHLGYRGAIKASNDAAAEMLDSSDVIWTDVVGRVRCRDREVTAYVDWLLQDWHRANEIPSCRLFLVSSGQSQWPTKILVLRPVGSAEDWFFRGPECTILVEREIRPALSVPEEFEGEFGRHFGLTPMEIRLAVALAGGATIQKAADTLGITAGTARVHLKSIFAKTDTHRQAELVALLARMRAPI